MLGAILSAVFGAIIGPVMFKVVPPAVDCVLYPDSCIEKVKKEVGYIKGNYTAFQNRISNGKKEVNIIQEDAVECTGEYISILDYNITTNNSTAVKQ